MVLPTYNKPNYLQWTIGILVVLMFLGTAFNYPDRTVDPVDYSKVKSIVTDELSKLNIATPTAQEIVTEMGQLDNDKISDIYDEIFEDDRIEAKAEELVLDEVDTKDFKEDLADYLEEEIGVIEDIDYKDITEIQVRDIDTVVDGETAEVTLEIKVYVNNYGDEDEEERARLEVTFEVDNLDPEDDFEDAEVDDFGDFELIRFYE